MLDGNGQAPRANKNTAKRFVTREKVKVYNNRFSSRVTKYP